MNLITQEKKSVSKDIKVWSEDQKVNSEKTNQSIIVGNKNEVRIDTHVLIHSICYSTNIYEMFLGSRQQQDETGEVPNLIKLPKWRGNSLRRVPLIQKPIKVNEDQMLKSLREHPKVLRLYPGGNGDS